MTSEEYEKLATDTLAGIKNFPIKECNAFSAIAQVYATLAVAAAQREWNELTRDGYGGATLRFINEGDNFLER